MVKKLINNMPCDKDRMDKYKNPTRLPAVVGKDAPQQFKDRFQFRYNTGESKALGYIGCFGSHIKALNSNVMIKKYERKCESVADYITLLNRGTDFKEYRELRNKQTLLQEVNLDELINSLHTFAIDKNYTKKIKTMVGHLLKQYTDIFKIVKSESA